MFDEHTTNALPLCIVYSDDLGLCRRLSGLLRERVYLLTADSLDQLRGFLTASKTDPVLIFLDLRKADATELVADLSGPVRDRTATVAIGVAGSTPYAAAEDARFYRVVEMAVVEEHRSLRGLAETALDRVLLMQENLMLRHELGRYHGTAEATGVPSISIGGSLRASLASQQMILPARHAEGLDTLFDRIVEGAASALTVTRIGLYYSSHEGQTYSLRAGRNCLGETLDFRGDDPLVRWLHRQGGQPLNRRSADLLTDPTGRMLVRRVLDLLGAESLIPLRVRGRLAGWLFTGLPFDGHGLDFHSLTLLAEYGVAALENAAHYEETNGQRILMESLFSLLPEAVIAVEADGVVRWFNKPAELLFPVLAARRRPGRPPPIIEDLSSRLAGLVYAALAGDCVKEPVVWEASVTARNYSARVHSLYTPDGRALGTCAVVEDVTERLRNRKKREVTERRSFCTDLAAGLAHEIRNPLVAIKTFVQLLPQRHADPEFRKEFGSLIDTEVVRLNGLLDRIDTFAKSPRELSCRPVQLLEVIRAAEQIAKKELPTADARIKYNQRLSIPAFNGDPAALARCFGYIFINGIESAMRKGSIPVVNIETALFGEGEGSLASGVRVAISDNGAGLAPEVTDRLFSPFCTTKAQGLGLGLPLAQQIILDHHGRLEVDSGTRGVCVHVLLPFHAPAAGSGTRPAGLLGPGSGAGQLGNRPAVGALA